MTVTVHNARKPLPEGYTPIYVGRKTTYRPEFGADFSILGNPYTTPKHSRSEAIVLYRQWLKGRLRVMIKEKVFYPNTAESRALQGIADRVKAGESLLLICWCAPLACHADVIKAEVERLVGTS